MFLFIFFLRNRMIDILIHQVWGRDTPHQKNNQVDLTSLLQILQQAPPLRRVDMPVNREQYENRVSYEEDDAERNVTINFQQSTQSDVDSHCSCAEVTVSYSSQSPSPPSRSSSTCGSYGPVMADSPSLRGSRNPSMLGSRSPSACVSRNPSMCGSLHPSMCGSRNPSVCGSRNPSMGGSRENVNSGRSTPKVLRLPRLQRLRSKGVLDWSHKPALKRTASHTPVSHRPPSVHTLLRRTRSSTTSHIREDRLSTCSYTTSSESLNSDGQSPTARQFLDHNHGECRALRAHWLLVVDPYSSTISCSVLVVRELNTMNTLMQALRSTFWSVCVGGGGGVLSRTGSIRRLWVGRSCSPGKLLKFEPFEWLEMHWNCHFVCVCVCVFVSFRRLKWVRS